MQNSLDQQQEFNNAFTEYSDALFRHCLFRVSNREAAIDLVQEAFTKTWTQIVKGEKIERFQPYLYHVLNNLIVDFYRKKKSVSLDALAEEGFDPSSTGADEIIEQAEEGILMKLLNALPKRDRDIVIMRYVDGFAVKQIADLVHESENGISVRLHRAIKKLRIISHQ